MNPYDKINALTDIQGDLTDIREKIMRLGNLNANIDTPLYQALYAIDQALEWQQVKAQDEPKSDMELTRQKQALLDAIADMDHEDLELSDAVGDTLDALNEAIEAKAEDVASFIFSLQADSAALKQEEQRLAERRRLNDAKVERMKTYLHDMLDDAGLDKVKGLKYTVGFRKSQAVDVLDLDTVPESLKRTKTIVEADKTAIKDALKRGIDVPGVLLIDKRNLSIK